MTTRSMTDGVVTIHHWTKTVTATETPSAGEDLSGLHAAEIIASVGAVTNIAASPQPSWTLTLQHSDAAGSGFAAVAASDVNQNTGNSDTLASGVFATINSAALDDATYRIGYIGSKRYVRVVATAAATPGATPISVVIVGEPKLKPGTDS